MYDYFLRAASPSGRMRDVASFLAEDDAAAIVDARRLSEGRSFALTRRGRTIRCPAEADLGDPQHLAAE